MELILFVGVPASGKSTFYKANFFTTHMRISLDLFRTRNKEGCFMDAAFRVQQRMVIDNTNVTRQARSLYLRAAQARKYHTVGYYFETTLAESLARNVLRQGKERIDERGIRAKYRELEIPDYEEGFDLLYSVSINNGSFYAKLIEK